EVLLADRLGLSTALATAFAVLAGALVAVGAGLAAAAAGRRIGFYEIAAAVVILLVLLFGPVLLSLPRLRASGLALTSWEAQGTLVVVLGLLLTGLLSGAATFIGASLGYLLLGSGRFDPSLGYELFIARSHLRLSPRTLAGLFLLVVTGVVPGLLVGMVWSFRRARQERQAARSGELTWRPRMPATLLMTLISIGGVAIGVWALTVVLSVMSGFEADLKKKILGTNAHALLLKYSSDFSEWKSVMPKVVSVPGVAGASPFILNEVILSQGQTPTGAELKGIDPATAGSVNELPKQVIAGELSWITDSSLIPTRGTAKPRDKARLLGDEQYLQDTFERKEAHPDELAKGIPEETLQKMPGICVGKEMSHALRAWVGDVIQVITPLGDMGPTGPIPRSKSFRVACILYSGMYEYDSKFAYIGIPDAQKFFRMGDSITGLELKFKDVDAARAEGRKVVAALGGFPYRAKDWAELNRNLFSALKLEKLAMAIILTFIVLVACFNILSTLIMLVLEKTKEISILKSMGARDSSVMKIFVLEGLVIGAIGTAMGLLLGLASCSFIERFGLQLDPDVYYISNLPVNVDSGQFVMVAFVAVALAYLATLYPATKASRLSPVDGLRED
ncbi:MAG: FtsX-like permease family protein, partial [Myxococcales bacterium]